MSAAIRPISILGEAVPTERSLVHNFGWMLRGNVIYIACQWGMVVAIAKAGKPEMLGVFTLASAIATPLFMLLNLQLRGVQVTDVNGDHSFREYLTVRFATTVLALSVVAAIALSQYDLETSLVICLVGMFKASESIGDIYYGSLQRNERMDRIAKSMMIKGGVALAVFVAALYFTGSIVWATCGIAFTSLGVLLSYDLPSVALVSGTSTSNRAVGTRQRVSNAARLAWIALPLGVVMGLVSFNLSLPRYFIAHFLGEHELGLFAAIAYILAGSSTVVEALGQAVTPRLANYYAAADTAAYRKTVVGLMAMGAFLGGSGVAAAYFWGPTILRVLYSANYAARADVFVLLMLATPALFTATFLCYAMTAARYFRAQLPIFLATTVMTGIGCATLLPRYGLHGVAIAILCSALVQWAGSAAVVLYAYRSLNRRRQVTSQP